MSGFYDNSSNLSMGQGGDQGGYQMFDTQYNSSQYPRLTGPPSHMDGVAFWYRNDNLEPVYERDPSLFNGTLGTLPSPMEASGVKHRRTRSGCFTCRSRRVKCDETRPICERCKKGGRECEFPQSTSSKRPKQSDSKSPQAGTKKHEKHDSRESTVSSLATIKDEDEGESTETKASRRPTLSKVRTNSTHSLGRKQRYRQASEPSPIFRDKSSPQSASSSSSHSMAETPGSSSTGAMSAEAHARQAKIKTLKPDVQRYLQFQQSFLTYYHYFFKLDASDWIHTGFIDEALSYEPLLCAVVGFAAYHYELKQPNAKLSRFLAYHSKALSMLRKSLENQPQYTPAMLLTVLQLATFEECLGDWVNLVGHQRAAHTMLIEIYTPENIMNTPTGRRILTWFVRMDVIASLMGGKTASLDRVWYEANANYYRARIDTDTDNDVDIDGHMSAFVASNRLISYDMAKLYSKVPGGQVSIAEFHDENEKIMQRLQDFKDAIASLNDGFYTAQEFPVEHDLPLTEDDIVNPYIPGGLFKDALWPMNYMWIDWYAIEMMQKYQASLLLRQPLPEELEALSLEQCRIYEAVSRWPDAPEGAVLGAHASIALAAVFLKKDERHTLWMRRKFAKVERLGYVFPPHYRTQMARVWGLTSDLVGEENSVEEWWLPHDEEKLPILSEIRKVVGERNKAGEDSGILAKDVEDIRDLKAIFAKLDIRTRPGVPRSGSFASADGFSPATSEGARSSPSTIVNSPSSATSLNMPGGEDRWARERSETQKDRDRASSGWS